MVIPKKAVTEENSFEILFPSLALEYSIKNERLISEFTYGSKAKGLWKCASCNYEWEASFKARSVSGTGCPSSECVGKKLIASNRYRSLKQGSLKDRFPKIANRFSEKRNSITVDKVSPFSHDTYWWECNDFDHPYQRSVAEEVTRKNCPYCFNVRLLKGFNDLLTVAPDISKELLPPLDPSGLLAYSNLKVFWKCFSCSHIWKTKLLARVNTGNGCPQCGTIQGFKTKRRIDLETRGSVADHISLMSEWSSKNILNPKTLNLSSREEVLWECFICTREWADPVNKRAGKVGSECPDCSRTSFLEFKVSKFISTCYRGIYHRNRKPITSPTGKLELDFWLPDLKLAFEVQDFATHSVHSDCEETEGVFRLHSEKSGRSIYKKGPTYHQRKIELAKSQLDVDLYEIWEDEIRDGSFALKVSEIISSRVAEFTLV